MEDIQELYEEILTNVGRFAFIVQSQAGWYMQVKRRVYKRYLGAEGSGAECLQEAATASEETNCLDDQ